MGGTSPQATRVRLAQPVLAPLFASPVTARVILVALGVLFALRWAGFIAWRCPLAAAAHVPCPGCGLTRSVVATARGALGEALSLHAFGPPTLAVLALVALAAVLPARARGHAARAVTRFEGTGVLAAALFALVGYWLVRLLTGSGAQLLST